MPSIREPLREAPNARNQGAKHRRGASPGEHLQRGVRPFGASPEGLALKRAHRGVTDPARGPTPGKVCAYRWALFNASAGAPWLMTRPRNRNWLRSRGLLFDALARRDNAASAPQRSAMARVRNSECSSGVASGSQCSTAIFFKRPKTCSGPRRSCLRASISPGLHVKRHERYPAKGSAACAFCMCARCSHTQGAFSGPVRDVLANHQTVS